jgi:hypothetical protein
MWTAIIALVFGVIAASTFSGSRHHVSSRISTKIGLQFSQTIAAEVAT